MPTLTRERIENKREEICWTISCKRPTDFLDSHHHGMMRNEEKYHYGVRVQRLKKKKSWRRQDSRPTTVVTVSRSFALEKKFVQLTKNWKEQTSGYSTSFHKSINSNYLQIIALGKPILPLILRELEQRPDHWFIALKAITEQNPVLPGHMGNIKKMRDDWVKWGKDQNII